MTVSIRPASAGDAPRVTQIYVESWNLGFGQLMPPLVLDSGWINRWATTLTNGKTKWWVADDDARLTGFVGIGPSRDPVDSELGELDTIAVAPEHWRSGIGTALMRTALDALAADGYREAILWTLADYARGQHFYESAGWIPDGNTRDHGHQLSYRHPLPPLR